MAYAQKKSQLILKWAVIIAVLILAAAAFIFREALVNFVKSSGPCMFNLTTGYYCPGCGNTRSARALLHGDVLLALRNNAVLPILAVVLLCLYIELIFSAVGKPRKILPRKPLLWWTVGILCGVYLVVRNFIPVLAPV